MTWENVEKWHLRLLIGTKSHPTMLGRESGLTCENEIRRNSRVKIASTGWIRTRTEDRTWVQTLGRIAAGELPRKVRSLRRG
ncbi:hypothetical protein GCM10009734_96860 [Nonomuraea bangladeshensis]